MIDPTSPNHDQPVEGSRSESYTRPDDGNLGGSTGSTGSTGSPSHSDFGGSTGLSDARPGASDKTTDVLESIRLAVEDFAEKATPVVLQFTAKAADVVATAADKAAPIAHKAGEATADASGRLAEKSRAWAAGTRQSLAGNGVADHPTDTTEPPASA